VNAESGIIAGQIGDAIWLRLQQRGCFQNSPDVEKYVQSRVVEGRKEFIVDLGGCGGLDSTFMGMLLGLAKRLMSLSGCIHIINAAGRNGQLLRGLGVHYFCSVSDDAGGFPQGEACGCSAAPEFTAAEVAVVSIAHETLSKQEQTTHCLKAHEELAAAQKQNEGKFRDVIALMREEAAKCPQ
jgi:anti-anti-sigma regulatory factor